MIARYIEERIRRPLPAGACIVPGSTPVVAFGDVRSAHVATLGLNPSRVEFVDNSGHLLIGEQRRLATQSSLGISDLCDATSEAVEEVLEDCNQYFQRQPYRRWFDRLLPALQVCRASYYDGTACHLDLVQWATDPTWGKLKPPIRKKLIAEDAAFLERQLRNENIRLLLVNGGGVWIQLKKAMRNDLVVDHHQGIIDAGLAFHPTRLYSGRLFRKIDVIAWSTNLQSSPGVTSLLREEELPRRIEGYVRSSVA
jgi:hypothetical protein